MSDLPWWVQPEVGDDTAWGLGDIATQIFIAPKMCSKWKFGGGPQLTWRTRTNERLVGPRFGAGFVGVAAGPITYDRSFSAIVGNTWSYDGDFNRFLFPPMLTYDLNALTGAYVSYNNAWTVDGKASSRNRWTIPVGLTVGRTFPLDDRGTAIDLSVGSYDYVESPAGGPAWSLEFGATLLLPWEARCAVWPNLRPGGCTRASVAGRTAATRGPGKVVENST